MDYQNTLDFAQTMDAHDPLARFRSRFHFPQHNGQDVRYFCGNSLGLQPKTASTYIEQELSDWAAYGVEGHFHGKNPWFSYHHFLTESLCLLTGALPGEVVAMNALTVNLHLMMVSFYRPTPERYKILCEAGAFPSDQYALESQVRFHGFEPDDAIIELQPREGEHCLRMEDILATIERNASSLALVLMPGVQYYTGQAFDMKTIAEAGHQAGAYVGFDLAHAIGNLQLSLHDWNADFAIWCSYKYLNSGPGAVSGIFVHERHSADASLPRFAGWWGNDEKERFLMKKGFHPAPGAAGWQLSNAPVFSMAIHRASLDIFAEAGMEAIAAKRDLLTGYAEFVIRQAQTVHDLKIITPQDPKERGAQLSLFAQKTGKELFNALTSAGFVADWREPNVIRIAPAPLYNSFEDVYALGQALMQC